MQCSCCVCPLTLLVCSGIGVVSSRTRFLIEDQLRPAPGGCLGLWGMRGLGKSTLAGAVVAAMQQELPGRTCLLEFPSAAQGAPVNIQQLRRELVLAALRALGVPLHARGKGEPHLPGTHPFQARLWRLAQPDACQLVRDRQN